ncbi:hypothetical protein B0H10DRAFT_2224508 [Mycena sp. CBHHK59/15]|nr:hypothetical protein B0H10DRAFT_2224508 [Mycena sp. CBHHK59/15]
MAQQDTVPVPEETIDRWTYPPFEGHVDTDGWIWDVEAGTARTCCAIAELSAVDELCSFAHHSRLV